MGKEGWRGQSMSSTGDVIRSGGKDAGGGLLQSWR